MGSLVNDNLKCISEHLCIKYLFRDICILPIHDLIAEADNTLQSVVALLIKESKP